MKKVRPGSLFDTWRLASGRLCLNNEPKAVTAWTVAMSPLVEVGIDIGSSATRASLIVAGKADEYLDVEFPSAVFLNGDSIVVGDEALSYREMNPSRFAARFKRILGAPSTRLSPGMALLIDHGKNSAMLSQVYAAIMAKVFDSLKVDPGRARAVVAHPVEWTDRHRSALHWASGQLGLRKVAYVTEPSAVLKAVEPVRLTYDSSHAAVFDLGASTLDVAVFPLGSEEMRAKSSTQLDLGGDDIDLELLDLISETCDEDDKQLVANYIESSPHRILDEVRDVKERLSVDESTVFALEGIDGVEIYREDLEERIERFIEDWIAALDGAVRAVSSDPVTIVATGASLAIPRLRAALDSYASAGSHPFYVVGEIKPDGPELAKTAVARGARSINSPIWHDTTGTIDPSFRVRSTSATPVKGAAAGLVGPGEVVIVRTTEIQPERGQVEWFGPSGILSHRPFGTAGAVTAFSVDRERGWLSLGGSNGAVAIVDGLTGDNVTHGWMKYHSDLDPVELVASSGHNVVWQTRSGRAWYVGEGWKRHPVALPKADWLHMSHLNSVYLAHEGRVLRYELVNSSSTDCGIELPAHFREPLVSSSNRYICFERLSSLQVLDTETQDSWPLTTSEQSIALGLVSLDDLDLLAIYTHPTDRVDLVNLVNSKLECQVPLHRMGNLRAASVGVKCLLAEATAAKVGQKDQYLHFTPSAFEPSVDR